VGKLFDRACHGRDGAACREVGLLYEAGKGLGKNPVLAQISFRRGCLMGDGDSCFESARLEAKKPSGGNQNELERLFGQGCAFRSALACSAAKLLYGDHRAVVPDPAKGAVWRKACAQADNRACLLSGLVSAARGMKAEAQMNLGRACNAGETLACRVAKQLK
jgi:hypothetical protein